MDDSQLPREQDEVARMLAALPRTAPLTDGEADRLVHRLRDERLLRAPRRWQPWLARAAAAAVIFALGTYAGARYARRDSLEEMLSRKDIGLSERVLLLQRAGSAYVHAAESYANATAKVDSGAVEVASQVLVGAANAIARKSLDAGMSARLTSALVPVRNTGPAKPIIWF